MEDKITKFQEAQMLLALISHSDGGGDVDFKASDISSELTKIVSNGNYVERYLYELNEAGVLYFEQVGEDGFSPIVLCSVTEATHNYLQALISSLEEEFIALNSRITEILGFNPNQLSRSISDTKDKLDEVSQHIQANKLLNPLQEPLREIQHHFESVSVVSAHYEDVYKNIIRPVQEAGESGVKATVKWAVISIFLSTAISLVLGNWDKLQALIWRVTADQIATTTPNLKEFEEKQTELVTDR